MKVNNVKSLAQEDRLREATEYCRPGGICVPNNPKLERSLKQCKKFNLKYWNPIREEQYLKSLEVMRRGAKRFRKRHGKEPRYILCNRIRLVIQRALKRKGSGKRGRYWENLVGYKLEELEKHLQSIVPKGYTWQDYLDGTLWIDHIIPVSAFNFSKPEHEDFKRCWALENLQLLLACDNVSKGRKIIRPFQSTFPI